MPAPSTPSAPPVVPGSRPERGLVWGAALQRWSDPVAYRQMQAFDDDHFENDVIDVPASTRRFRREILALHHEKLDAAMLRKLFQGVLFASGIGGYFGSGRHVIEPSALEFLAFEEEGYAFRGHGLHYEDIEVFEAAAIPRNIEVVPGWLLEIAAKGLPPSEFEFAPDYRHVTLRGLTFTLGEVQGSVVRLLHEAALRGDPWLFGKTLLEAAKSRSMRMNDVFKSQPHWRELIESDQRGFYRLKLDSPDLSRRSLGAPLAPRRG